ncbi:chemotaxis-specific protein-glutamate methyltransferase CheB [Lacibacterium aquatile]|uniref:Protein-glutamate methylesterase/protein-glutamine glutaminase n=1 Tax=Lacibacterium aquatile TaxID=1168082 RepID=A0ABW5DN66_9PROT
MIKVLVVDDLGFMRIALRQIIEAEGDLTVVGQARNGVEAVEMAETLKPDVITMDIEMPEMDGIEATKRIMGFANPPPIVMVSSHTQEGAESTIRALRGGAVDFVSKSSSFTQNDLGQINKELRPKLRQWAGQRPRRQLPTPVPVKGKALEPTQDNGRTLDTARTGEGADLIVIGVSTGGPQTLPRLLMAMGPVPVPIVIAQHMPEFFTRSMAEFLGQETGLNVFEAASGVQVGPGAVAVLKGGRDWMVAPKADGFVVRGASAPGTVHPSVDTLFRSAALAARRPIAVILTGMGDDGTEGASHFHRRGLPVLVQTPETCVVGGMPSAAIEAGHASHVLSIEALASRLSRWAKSNRIQTSASVS